MSAGVCSPLIIELAKKKPKTPRTILRSKKLIKEVDKMCIRDRLHCVFRHNIVGTLVDTLRWNLACDISAENIMNELDICLLYTSRCV